MACHFPPRPRRHPSPIPRWLPGETLPARRAGTEEYRSHFGCVWYSIKLSAVGDTANHLVLGWGIDRGPKPDLTEARPTVRDALSHQPMGALLGDPGYEAEGFHRFCRARDIRSILPTTDRGRPRADGQPRVVRGHYRKLMKAHFPKVLYGQRWQAETIFSMLKRNFGSELRARSYHSQNREIRLRVLTHDLGILLRPHVTRCPRMFYTEQDVAPGSTFSAHHI